MKIAIYARVSTLDKGQDVNLQLDELRQYAIKEGHQIYREYVDDGISGAKEDRPAFTSMMEDAYHGRFKAVIVWKMSRFSRKFEHLLKYTGILKDLEIEFISVRDKIDTSTPVGRLFFHIKGAFDEFERDNTRENIIAGLANAKRKGKRLGAKPKTLDLNRVCQLHEQGLSTRQIAAELGGVTYQTIRRALRSFVTNEQPTNAGKSEGLQPKP